MTIVDENYYINVADYMENEQVHLTSLEQKFIDLYNNTTLPVRKIRVKLGITQAKYYKMFHELKPYLQVRRKGNHRKTNKKFEPSNYSFNHTNNVFNIVKRGRYFGCCRTEREAKMMVELFEANGWDYDCRHTVKEQVLKECRFK